MTTPPVPETRVAPVSETLHGATIDDPYRWLEEDSPEQRAWTAAQNAYGEAVLGTLPGREALRGRLADLLGVGMVTTPKLRHGKLFLLKREGAQNQPCLYVRKGDATRVLLDPNQLSEKGTIALDWWYPSPDGTYVAYGLSSDGDERSTLHIRATATGADLPDRIPDARHASVTWLPDNSGFYYTRLPARGSVPAGEENYNVRVRFHALGANPDADPVVFGEGRAPETMLGIELSPNGRWLLVSAAIGWARNDLYLLDRHAEGGKFWPLIEGREALYRGQPLDDCMYLTTNEAAPNFRVFRTTYDATARERWAEVVAEQDAPLQECRALGERLVLAYLRDATADLRIVAADGAAMQRATLPGLGTIGELSGEGDEAYFGYTSFFDPPGIWRCDLATGETTPTECPASAPDTSDLVAEQAWYTSTTGRACRCSCCGVATWRGTVPARPC